MGEKETVNVSFSVSIVSLHLKICKVCIEPDGNARGLGGGGGNFSVRNPLDLSYRDPLDTRSARKSKSAPDEAQEE
jgi:hypothetical protein